MVNTVVYMVEDITALGGVQKHVLDASDEFIKAGYEVEVVSRFGAGNSIRDLPFSRVDFLYPANYPTLLESEQRGQNVDHRLAAIRESVASKLREIIDPYDASFMIIAAQYGSLWELDRIGWLTSDRATSVIGAYHSSFQYANAQAYYTLLINLLKRCDAAVFLTEEDRLDFEKGGVTNTVTIPNAIKKIDEKVFPIRGNEAVYLGRFEEEKGVEELIELWAEGLFAERELPDLVLYGAGTLEERLQEMIKEHSVSDRVRIAGRTTQPLNVLAQAEIVVSCSPREGFPMTLLEASSTGTPAVVYDAGSGTVELVRDNGTGFVVSVGDREAFFDAVEKLHNDESIWSQASQNGRIAAKFYSPERIHGKWNRLFEGLQPDKWPSGKKPSPSEGNLRTVFSLPEPMHIEEVVLMLGTKVYQPRSFLLLLKTFDASIKNVSHEVLEADFSEIFNTHFVNVPGIDGTAGTSNIVIPTKTKFPVSALDIEFIRWGTKAHSPRKEIRAAFVKCRIGTEQVYFKLDLMENK